MVGQQIDINKTVASFGLFSAFFIASFIALFSLLTDQVLNFMISKANLSLSFLAAAFIFTMIIKYIISLKEDLHWIYDILIFSLVVALINVIFLIIAHGEMNLISLRFLLIINLTIVIGWSFGGALYWYNKIYP